MARRNLRNIDQRIINRAIEEGAAKGIDGISTKKIASLLRITEPTIYVHFGTKDNLLKEAYQTAVATLYDIVGLSADDNLDVTAPHNFMIVAKQAQTHRNEVIYVFNYRHTPGFIEFMTTKTPQGEAIFEALRSAWHHGNSQDNPAPFCPYIDNQLYYYVLETISGFVYAIAKNELPADETTAKFFSALLLSSLRNGKALFKSMLTEENKEELKQKAANCGLLQDEKKD
jgi:AcrR family transcriptional regulator